MATSKESPPDSVSSDGDEFARSNRGQSVADVHSRLRELVLQGNLAPESIVSQVDLARTLGVSRTPLREAFRMLQEEGLITAIPNRRARVRGFDADELDSLYAARILLESHGAAVTVPDMDETDFSVLEESIEIMRSSADHNDISHWEAAHRRFHMQVVRRSGEALLQTIRSYYDRAERYRRVYLKPELRFWRSSEHVEIIEACRTHDPYTAASALAPHLAKTALTLMAATMPEFEPVGVRTALRLITGRPVSVEP